MPPRLPLCYPAHSPPIRSPPCSPRAVEDKQSGERRGVVGSAELLAERAVSCQPVAGFDWSRDKAGAFVSAALDQTLRVGLVSRVASL